MFLQILAVIAEFEANLIRHRTREGMAIARQNGQLRGKQPTLKPAQDRKTRRMHGSGDHNIAGIAALFSVSRPTGYRSLERATTLPPLPAGARPTPDLATYDQLLTPKGCATRPYFAPDDPFPTGSPCCGWSLRAAQTSASPTTWWWRSTRSKST
jgi:hypothetical protein